MSRLDAFFFFFCCFWGCEILAAHERPLGHHMLWWLSRLKTIASQQKRPNLPPLALHMSQFTSGSSKISLPPKFIQTELHH